MTEIRHLGNFIGLSSLSIEDLASMTREEVKARFPGQGDWKSPELAAWDHLEGCRFWSSLDGDYTEVH